jgi:putative hydrolase of the HAD superfamily
MIKTIIFDFGGVFIDLDKEAISNLLERLGDSSILSERMIDHNERYEKGLIGTKEFISFYKEQFPGVTDQKLIIAWNSIILELPEHRLKFIEELHAKGQFQLILLSNTNELNIQKATENMGFNRYNRFKDSFHFFYLSHEIKMRKPDIEIFKHVLDTHKLIPNECLFIDDTTTHTNSASSLGIHTWNIDSDNEDVTSLFKTKRSLFN